MAIELTLWWQGLGAPAYSRRFRSAANINDFSPVLREIAYVAIAPAIRRNFDEGGRPKWKKLSKSTIDTKVRKGYFAPYKILVATGALMESASDPEEYRIGTHDIIARPSPDYWLYHQKGTRNMPQRVIMNLQRGDQRKIGGLFNKFVISELAKHGLKVDRGTTIMVGGGG